MGKGRPQSILPEPETPGIPASCPALGQGLGLAGVPPPQCAEGPNKPINHWNAHKTDRSGEVMLIKPLNLVFNPCSNLFAEHAHFFLEIS